MFLWLVYWDKNVLYRMRKLFFIYYHLLVYYVVQVSFFTVNLFWRFIFLSFNIFVIYFYTLEVRLFIQIGLIDMFFLCSFDSVFITDGEGFLFTAPRVIAFRDCLLFDGSLCKCLRCWYFERSWVTFRVDA